ncbi:hypothetical protein [Anaerocolumna xylanovorans]|uniref:Uncharacterized protein n=1 Tax=Anaerocolumna xylanovorans DSM 12503 TaxID=1121345 RepID=A0A1M7Y1B6_9FIRM|nr:hypothetical protein [Anaerocolumna xylanovorans]SHO45540.1 hypothetical protein SAMN02745217_00990 [Anaerocolumna xylanovorans DSM 12503]
MDKIKVLYKKAPFLLILTLGFIMVLLIFFISVLSVPSDTDDYKEYKRILKTTGYTDNPLLANFPVSIPDNARDTAFYYTPRFLQGGEVWSLSYKTDIAEVISREEAFRAKAVWIGATSDYEAAEYGVTDSDFSYAGYDVLPEDFTVYLFYSKPYKENNWNHGSISMAAVSIEKRQLIFYAEDW